MNQRKRRRQRRPSRDRKPPPVPTRGGNAHARFMLDTHPPPEREIQAGQGEVARRPDPLAASAGTSRRKAAAYNPRGTSRPSPQPANPDREILNPTPWTPNPKLETVVLNPTPPQTPHRPPPPLEIVSDVFANRKGFKPWYKFCTRPLDMTRIMI